MTLHCINHLAFITNNMTKAVRFYRDLLGMQLTAGIGHDGYRHYFFRMADKHRILLSLNTTALSP
jgi:catechol 2,3-dioxygenase-like lactoylglutathione lyase family enzyme